MLSQAVARPGDTVELSPLTTALKAKRSIDIVKTENVEIIQLLVPAGADVPTYEAEGEIVLHCLIGRISVAVFDQMHVLNAGQLLYLVVNEPFSIHGVENSSVLATIIAPKQGQNTELIGSSKPR